MGALDGVKALFCTWQGIDKVKRALNLVCGAGVILCGVLSLINVEDFIADLTNPVRQGWNCLFGVLMISLQFKMTAWVDRRFGFLKGWFGRGLFYLLCVAALAPLQCTPPPSLP